MKKFLRENWHILFILIAPFPIIGMYWSQLSEQIPIHWNIEGEVDSMTSKAGILLTPVLNIVLFFILIICQRIDPKRLNYDLFSNRFTGIRLSIHAFVFMVFIFTLLTALAVHYDFNRAMMTGLLMLFIILGNYMAAVRPNYFVGIRTPWTLANEEVWTKTHRLTSKIWVIVSFIMLVMLWITHLPPTFIVGGIIIMTLIPAIYSLVIFQKLKKAGGNGPGSQ